MNSFKKILFILLAFTGQATASVPKRIAILTLAALAANVSVAECATQYNDEATRNLLHAIVENDLGMAEKAFEEGANPNGTNKESLLEESFLLLATSSQYSEMVQLLLLHNANVNVTCKASGQTPLIFATKAGDAETVKALLNHKNISRRTQDFFGKTALDWARDMTKVYKGHEKITAYQECIRLLSDHR